MKLAILIAELVSFTVALVLSVLYQSHGAFMLSIVLQVLPVLLTRDHSQRTGGTSHFGLHGPEQVCSEQDGWK